VTFRSSIDERPFFGPHLTVTKSIT
jgi:hypothetical protein